MMTTTKTTVKNPPQLIDKIRIPGIEGVLGITSCPGMQDDFAFDLYSESLLDDLQAIRSWGAAVVVTLLEESELNVLGVRDLGKNVVALNMVWLHLPIKNTSLPDERFYEKWRMVVPSLCNLLRKGQHVLIHCKEGIGRAGLVATSLLVELGVPVNEAIDIVRKARPGSLYLNSHEQFCQSLADRKQDCNNVATSF